jgi:hypothetical protein
VVTERIEDVVERVRGYFEGRQDRIEEEDFALLLCDEVEMLRRSVFVAPEPRARLRPLVAHGWTRIGRYDTAMRRALWFRFSNAGFELRSGREGDDSHITVTKEHPDYHALLMVFLRADHRENGGYADSGKEVERLTKERDNLRRELDEAKAASEARVAELTEQGTRYIGTFVGAHTDEDLDNCPTFHDGCHCTVETLLHNIAQAEKSESRVAELEAKWPERRKCPTNWHRITRGGGHPKDCQCGGRGQLAVPPPEGTPTLDAAIDRVVAERDCEWFREIHADFKSVLGDDVGGSFPITPAAVPGLMASLAARVRREALEEAAEVAAATNCAGVSSEWDAARDACADAIRALMEATDAE